MNEEIPVVTPCVLTVVWYLGYQNRPTKATKIAELDDKNCLLWREDDWIVREKSDIFFDEAKATQSAMLANMEGIANLFKINEELKKRLEELS